MATYQEDTRCTCDQGQQNYTNLQTIQVHEGRPDQTPPKVITLPPGVKKFIILYYNSGNENPISPMLSVSLRYSHFKAIGSRR